MEKGVRKGKMNDNSKGKVYVCVCVCVCVRKLMLVP